MYKDEHTIHNVRLQSVGNMKDGVYYTDRDYNKSQLFYKFDNAISIDSHILKNMIVANVKWIRVLVKNVERMSFIVELGLQEFLELSTKINYDKQTKLGISTKWSSQRRLGLSKWRRHNSSQKKL